MKSVACSALKNLSHLKFPLIIWEETTHFSSRNKIIALIKQNWSFTSSKKLKSVWCAYFVITREQKTLPRGKLWENICCRKTTLSWRPKMVTKNMRNFMTFHHCLMKSWRNKNFMQPHWESILRKLRSLLTTKNKPKKNWNQKLKTKIKCNNKRVNNKANGMMQTVRGKNGKMTPKMMQTKQSNSKMRTKQRK